MNAPINKGKPLKIRKVGNSLGVVLTKDLLDRLGVSEGDLLYPVDNPDGVMLTPHDPDFEEVMNAVDRTRRRYRNTLRELAK